MAQINLKVKIDVPSLREEVDKLLAEIQSKLDEFGEISLAVNTQNSQEEVDDLNEKVKETERSTEKTTDKFAKWGMVVTGLKSSFDIISGVVATMRNIIDVAEEQELATKRMALAFQQSGNMSADSAERATREFNSFASSLQKVTNYGDEVIVKAAAMGNQLTGATGQDLQRMTIAAMNLSSALGIDLDAAMQKIAASAEAGAPVFRGASEEYKKALSSANNETERLNITLDYLDKKFAGTAEAMKTTGKSFDNTIGDIGESLGTLLGNVLNPLMQAVGGLVTWFNELPLAIQGVIFAVAGLTAAFVALNFSIGGIPLIIGGIVTAVAGLLTAVGGDKGLNSLLKETGEHYENLKTKGEKYITSIDTMSESQLLNARAISQTNIELLKQKLLTDEASKTFIPWYSKILGFLTLAPTELSAVTELTEFGKVLRDELALQNLVMDKIETRLNNKKKIVTDANNNEKVSRQQLHYDLKLAEKEFYDELDRYAQEKLNNDITLNDMKIASDRQRQLVQLQIEGNLRDIERAQIRAWYEDQLVIYENDLTMKADLYLLYLKKLKDMDDKHEKEQNDAKRANLTLLAQQYEQHFNDLVTMAQTATTSQMSFVNQFRNYILKALQDELIKFLAVKAAETTGHATAETTKTAVTSGNVAARIGLYAIEAVKTLAVGAASIASAIAQGISYLFTTMGPLALAVIPAVAAGVYALWGGVKRTLGFKSGGYTGKGNPDEEAGVVHREEYVFPADVVSGQSSKWDMLKEMLRRGLSIDDLISMGASKIRSAMPNPYFFNSLSGVSLATASGAGSQSFFASENGNLLKSIDDRLRRLEEKGLVEFEPINIKEELRGENIYRSYQLVSKSAAKRKLEVNNE